ncbi:unnamed protein product [Durusdinium trenchii]|uniref:Uncharacterized protein n=1 Tax=Durusdinium trenchii TaxID=1381693 RepID=A0ABP0QG12_9DINO
MSDGNSPAEEILPTPAPAAPAPPVVPAAPASDSRPLNELQDYPDAKGSTIRNDAESKDIAATAIRSKSHDTSARPNNETEEVLAPAPRKSGRRKTMEPSRARKSPLERQRLSKSPEGNEQESRRVGVRSKTDADLSRTIRVIEAEGEAKDTAATAIRSKSHDTSARPNNETEEVLAPAPRKSGRRKTMEPSRARKSPLERQRLSTSPEGNEQDMVATAIRSKSHEADGRVPQQADEESSSPSRLREFLKPTVDFVALSKLVAKKNIKQRNQTKADKPEVPVPPTRDLQLIRMTFSTARRAILRRASVGHADHGSPRTAIRLAIRTVGRAASMAMRGRRAKAVRMMRIFVAAKKRNDFPEEQRRYNAEVQMDEIMEEHVTSIFWQCVLLKIDTYENIIPELLKAFAEPGAGVMESMPDLRRVLEAHLRHLEAEVDDAVESGDYDASTNSSKTKQEYRRIVEKVMEEASHIRSLVIYSRTISRMGRMQNVAHGDDAESLLNKIMQLDASKRLLRKLTEDSEEPVLRMRPPRPRRRRVKAKGSQSESQRGDESNELDEFGRGTLEVESGRADASSDRGESLSSENSSSESYSSESEAIEEEDEDIEDDTQRPRSDIDASPLDNATSEAGDSELEAPSVSAAVEKNEQQQQQEQEHANEMAEAGERGERGGQRGGGEGGGGDHEETEKARDARDATHGHDGPQESQSSRPPTFASEGSRTFSGKLTLGPDWRRLVSEAAEEAINLEAMWAESAELVHIATLELSEDWEQIAEEYIADCEERVVIKDNRGQILTLPGDVPSPSDFPLEVFQQDTSKAVLTLPGDVGSPSYSSAIREDQETPQRSTSKAQVKRRLIYSNAPKGRGRMAFSWGAWEEDEPQTSRAPSRTATAEHLNHLDILVEQADVPLASLEGRSPGPPGSTPSLAGNSPGLPGSTPGVPENSPEEPGSLPGSRESEKRTPSTGTQSFAWLQDSVLPRKVKMNLQKLRHDPGAEVRGSPVTSVEMRSTMYPASPKIVKVNGESSLAALRRTRKTRHCCLDADEVRILRDQQEDEERIISSWRENSGEALVPMLDLLPVIGGEASRGKFCVANMPFGHTAKPRFHYTEFEESNQAYPQELPRPKTQPPRPGTRLLGKMRSPLVQIKEDFRSITSLTSFHRLCKVQK